MANALKYSKANTIPIVHIYSKEDVNNIFVFIEDNGVGISEEKLSIIFEPFKRGGKNLPSSGTGLGLATCKKIMKNYKGDIKVESSLNAGSKFQFGLTALLQLHTFD